MLKADIKTSKGVASDDSYYVKIMEYIKERGSVDLKALKAELDISHQTLQRNLRKLCQDGKIKPYIKITPDTGFTLPNKNEIYFSILVDHYEYPHEIERLIDDMCSKDENKVHDAFEKFVNLCVKKQLTVKGLPIVPYNTPKETKAFARWLAYCLMNDQLVKNPEDFKEIRQTVAFNLLSDKLVK